MKFFESFKVVPLLISLLAFLIAHLGALVSVLPADRSAKDRHTAIVLIVYIEVTPEVMRAHVHARGVAGVLSVHAISSIFYLNAAIVLRLAIYQTPAIVILLG